MTTQRRMLIALLLMLVLLYAAWFGRPVQWVALAVFALPPLWLAIATMLGAWRSGFWAGLLALLWFSHGVMVAWTRAPERGLALTEIALAVAIVLVASVPGLRVRFVRRA